jgi:predicted alpha-1,2-mannosidase
VALSTVDVAGARANLATAHGLGFDRVKRDGREQWNGLLGRVRGPTGEVMATPGGVYCSTLSLWETFRGVHPLHTLLVPERVPGVVNSLLAHHRAMGHLPLWTAWGRETHTMIGNPALSVLAEAVAKVFVGFDRAEVLRAMVETSTRPRPDAPPWAQRDWADLEHFGYLPFDRIAHESVSLTLELGVGDDAVARVARALGDSRTADRFARRAGGWREPFDPLVPTSPMNNPGDHTEANAWQYTLTPALHDPAGLVAAMGGEAAFEAWLDRFFTLPSLGENKHLGQEALVGQYAHGNEPCHPIAWLCTFTASPHKGHTRVREARLMPAGGKLLRIVGGGGASPQLDGQPLSARGTPHAVLQRGGVLRWR